MATHPITAEQAEAIYGGFTEVRGDPLNLFGGQVERHKASAKRELPIITKLIQDLNTLQELVLDRTQTGHLYSDEDFLRLSIAEGYAAMEGIDEGMPLPDLIKNLRFELGKIEV